MCIGISLSINLIDWRETRFSSGMQVSWSIATDIDVRITHQLPEMSRCTNCQWAKLKINQRLTWCFKYTFFFGCNGRCSARCSCRRSYSCKMCTRKGLPCRSSCLTPTTRLHPFLIFSLTSYLYILMTIIKLIITVVIKITFIACSHNVTDKC